jgi:RimJ/RimL family protein N-acetyltransferase
LGNKKYGGLGTRAVAEMLTIGFTELGLEAINAWTVETNLGGRHVVERLHFTYIGRQRRCHYVDGRHLDRLLFDILATEHEGTSHAGPDDTRASNFHAVR